MSIDQKTLWRWSRTLYRERYERIQVDVLPALSHTTISQRVLRVAAEEAGVPWVTCHSFRHTCASLLFSAGRNVKQVQRWLGHSSPSFTLETYVHLLDDGVGGGLDLASELAVAGSESKVSPDLSELDGTGRESAIAAPAF